ncbi:MAG: transcription termination factor Rho [Aminobacterium sp.]|jgi:transcription termination factor Rho|uniref:transcription termination factor Rho n=1 Tax=unclassified Aminobacterium TaxID=2685012 RepID=UPI002A3241E7|nr:transcription termination factor Rho [Aminobacterium sp.]MDD4227925.1 transcription termination factor Rho [Aminobacterium sp.]MDD4552469.1 transcription termination factor Rho [Aminobacterium sp.]MEA4876490.1 transcription termination factor Rho [Aminobacterium sp.]
MTDNQNSENNMIDKPINTENEVPEVNETEEEAEVEVAEVKSVPRPRYNYAKLSSQLITELRKIAKDIGVTGFSSLRKDDLIIAILTTQAEQLNYRFGGGTLEILNEGYGFLRPKGLLPSDHDIYVSASQIRRFGLRNGDVVWGMVRPPKEQEHYEALLRVEMVNFADPEAARRRPHFGALTPIFPDSRLTLETDPKEISTRLIDLFAPVGKGQRALLVSPPKAGKTTVLKKIANAVTVNHPDIILMVLLIDERPEEVTDMARSVDGEIIASTFDRPAEEHLRVANLTLEKAKRLVETGKDVVLLLDSITRLARASNLVVPPSGRTLSGGMDPAALYFPKRFFGAARNIEEGGSLTIIGTALVDTGSRMDDVIYEEFKGTGNMELHLSRKLSEQRIFPAVDITKSGTRREELLMPEEDLSRIWLLRRRMVNVDEAGALSLIIDKLKKSPTNKDFLLTIKMA